MQKDNVQMIESLTNLPVLSLVAEGDKELNIDIEKLTSLYL